MFEKGVGCLGYAGLKTNEMIFFLMGTCSIKAVSYLWLGNLGGT